MKLSILLAGLSVISLLAASDPARAEQSKSRLYAFHSSAIGACPGMDWHIVVSPDQSMSGFIAWDGMKHFAKVSGKLETGRIFHLAAAEEGGAERSGSIKGQVEDTFIVASLQGTRTACDDQQISVPYFASGQSGGGG
jgi:hypothetical protein